MTLGVRIGIIVALQTIALLGMVGIKQFTLSTGSPIVLKTQPIDPRSLFSGDYVRLNYAISELDVQKLEGDKTFARGDTAYVVLKQGIEYWEPVSVHRDYPAIATNQKVIKGEVQYLNGDPWRSAKERAEPIKQVNVKYGIENYFVPENEGRELERPKPGETVSILVVVDKYGNPAIKAVRVNGVEKYVETLW